MSKMIQKLSRGVAWLILLAIVSVTVVPPTLRPTTPTPHIIEHAAAFFVNAIAFSVGYPQRELVLSIGAVLFCAGIEAVQLFVPGRHARLSDFLVDAAAAVAGIFVAQFVIGMLEITPKARRR